MAGSGQRLNEVEFSSRDAWRAWLARHHETESEVWLVFRKGVEAAAGIGYDEAVEEALCFGWVDSLIKRLDDRRCPQVHAAKGEQPVVDGEPAAVAGSARARAAGSTRAGAGADGPQR
jgi:hypothetical protein